MSLKGIAAVLVVVCAGTLAHAQTVLWDTGAPHQVVFNNNPTYLGYVSGNAGAGLEQRWAAIPFRLPGPISVITQIDVDWFIVAGQEAETVNYIIWRRNGLNRPVDGDQVASGVLGAFGPGIDDPRVPGTEDWLHQYTGLNISLPGGDYYLTVYGDGGTAPNVIAWLTGGDLQAEDLEQGFMWRSATFPNPGFQQYAPSTIQPAPGQDPDDRWNPSFTIYGYIVPEPATLLALSAGLAGVALRRRKR